MDATERLEDTLPGSFEPDTILPTQFYELRKNRNLLQGERRLMFAVLEDAVYCYLKYMDAKSRNRRILYLEVREWMNSTRSNGLFSYDVLCTELGINGAGLRDALEKRRVRHQSGPLYVGSRRRRKKGATADTANNGAQQPSENITAECIDPTA
jgi:hypothetical protein